MRNITFSHGEISAFCLGIAHLLHAGLSPGDALTLLSQDEGEKGHKSLLCAMAQQADGGAGLAEVLMNAGAFPHYVCAMAAAGEETGRTEEALFALADYYENRARLDRQLRAALLHPLALMGVLLIVVAALLVWVLPVFDDVYRQLGSSLTGIAGGLLALGQLLRAGMPVLLPLALLLCAVCLWLFRSERGREKLLSILRKREFFAQVDAARLTQVLAMALCSGLDGERAMHLALALGEEGTTFRRKCEDCLSRLEGETPLPQALRESGLLPAADCRLLEAGYRGGCADTVMTQLARRVQERSEAQLEAWLGRVEPALVLTASVLVGAVLLCVLLPLTRIMAAIG